MEKEEKTSEARKMEEAAAALERKIVRFTNIDSESFTHSFRGVSVTIKPGTAMVLRMPEANHYAKHLARKMLSRDKKKATDMKQGVQLWKDEEVNDLKKKMLSDVGQESGPENMSAEEAHAQDTARLEKEFGQEKAPVQPTRKELIADLESRKLTVDPNASNADLQQQIMDAEEKGITADSLE